LNVFLQSIKCVVGLLRRLVENTSQDFGGAGHGMDDDGVRSIRTVVPHELERVEDEDEDPIVWQEHQQ